MSPKPYRRLLLMAILSFLSLYVLMYMMVDSFENVYLNVNQLYMAGMMTAALVIFELMLMGAMYPNKQVNAMLMLTSIVVGGLFVAGIRTQTGVSDTQLMKSMIPHHGGAILMCEENKLEDPELQALCQQIVESQLEEIDVMRTKLQQQK